MLDGPCRSGEVVGYLDALAEESGSSGGEAVVVLDNAPFHTAKAVKAAKAAKAVKAVKAVKGRRPAWEAKGLKLRRLPACCPRLDLVEGAWRRVEGLLMPRRFYDSVAELKRAVLHALRLLGAVEVQC